ncbi:MAG: GSU3473 family protein [bacterium]
MYIKVKYPGGRYDEVKPWLLDEMILKGSIDSFQRSTGWVVIGKYNIRGMGGKYKGRERRQADNQNNYRLM